jgi:hypothetical protein
LAEVRFQVLGRSYKSTLSSIGGHIFDLATTPGARKVAFVPPEEIVDDVEKVVGAAQQ